MRVYGTVRIGVVGYCPPTRFDEVEARRMVNEAYDKIVRDFGPNEVSVVSGLTNVGVLKIAYEEATKRGWRTVGVACKRAEEHDLYPVNLKVIIGENWGEESANFLENIDMMVRIGGGKQSLRETQAVKDRGDPVYEYDLPAMS